MITRFSALLLVAWFFPFSSFYGEGGAPKAETGLPPGQVCPLSEQTYKVWVETTDLVGTVGDPVTLALKISPYPPPSGFFFSSAVDILGGPSGPRPFVLTGVPRIELKFFTPGTYRLRVQVNLIAKSSCGGAKARIISEHEVTCLIKG